VQRVGRRAAWAFCAKVSLDLERRGAGGNQRGALRRGFGREETSK